MSAMPLEEPVDFAWLKLPRRTNAFLMLPEGFRGGDEPDARSPMFKAAPDALLARAREIVLAEPRVGLVRDVADGQFTVVQRSALFRFPDYVTIQALPAGEGRSALAILSRSKYGRYDLGVNKARVARWLEAIRAAV